MFDEERLDEIKQEIATRKESGNLATIQDNALVNALVDNETAVDIVKEQYKSLPNQKQIAKKIGKVVNEKTNADIETADLLVKDQVVSNKVKKAEQKNKLLQLKNERIYIEKEQKHKLAMQRQKHLRDKYEDLLLRTCRKKQKGEDGKWHYLDDENGKPIINIPSAFKFFWIRLFDGIVSTLNLTAEIFSALNKNVLKGGFIILIILMLFVPPFREFVLGLIGIKLG